MSDEIKVGDICEVMNACCPLAGYLIVGAECVVTPTTCCVGEPLYCLACGATFADLLTIETDAVPESKLGFPLHWPRQFLRKKPPKADASQWIREQTVPREKFERWREQVRRGARIGEPA